VRSTLVNGSPITSFVGACRDLQSQCLFAQLRERAELIDELLDLGLLRLDAQEVRLREATRRDGRANLLEVRADLRQLALRDDELQLRADPLVVREASAVRGAQLGRAHVRACGGRALLGSADRARVTEHVVRERDDDLRGRRVVVEDLRECDRPAAERRRIWVVDSRGACTTARRHAGYAASFAASTDAIADRARHLAHGGGRDARARCGLLGGQATGDEHRAELDVGFDRLCVRGRRDGGDQREQEAFESHDHSFQCVITRTRPSTKPGTMSATTATAPASVAAAPVSTVQSGELEIAAANTAPGAVRVHALLRVVSMNRLCDRLRPIAV
jgi:hypothetical protein